MPPEAGLCCGTAHCWLPNACITATHYRGGDRASGQLDAQTITGPLDRQVADAVTFAVRNMRVGAYKMPARMDLPQYSDEALFEALVNAVVHRDYSIRGSRIRLSMFADRIEINSPGGLANNLTIDSMAARQSTRNEAVASVLGRMPVGEISGSGNRRFFMERRGDGVSIIFRTTRALSGKLPEYRILAESDLFLTIPAAATDPTPATVTIVVQYAARPVADVELLALFPDNTGQHVTTDANGEAALELPATDLPMTVFAAARGFAAHVAREWVPAAGALGIGLEPLPHGGAVIFPEASGRVPRADRKASIRSATTTTGPTSTRITSPSTRGRRQPVHFVPGEDLRLTDADGAELTVRIVEIAGRAALVEYRPFD